MRDLIEMLESRARTRSRRGGSGSIDPRIRRRLDSLLNDPKYAEVFITIEDRGVERYAIYYSWGDGYRRAEDPKGVLQFRRMGWSPAHGQCANAWEIAYSSASKGWGALLYEVALELAGVDGLVPDRFVVSKDAKSVWDKYEARSDVKSVQLDVIRGSVSWKGFHPPEQITPDKPEDDCEQQSAVAYGGREGWQGVSISKKYVKRGTGVMDALRDAGRLVEK
jgi:hypothetical protein